MRSKFGVEYRWPARRDQQAGLIGPRQDRLEKAAKIVRVVGREREVVDLNPPGQHEIQDI